MLVTSALIDDVVALGLVVVLVLVVAVVVVVVVAAAAAVVEALVPVVDGSILADKLWRFVK